MEVLRYPETCQICSGILRGSAEIELKREGESYYIITRQTAPLDFDLCPRCKQIACFASCWDKQRGYCKSCPSYDAAGSCPECKKELTGAIEIVETTMNGIPTIRFQETSDRNWIQCDACNLVVCKSCCRNARSGYCNECSARINQAALGQVIVIEQGRALHDAANFSQPKAHLSNQTQGHQEQQKQTTQTDLGGQTK